MVTTHPCGMKASLHGPYPGFLMKEACGWEVLLHVSGGSPGDRTGPCLLQQCHLWKGQLCCAVKGWACKWQRPRSGGPSGRLGGSHGLLEDLGVDASHAIDGVRPSDAQVGHVDTLHRALFHKRHTPQPVYIPWERGCHPLCQRTQS